MIQSEKTDSLLLLVDASKSSLIDEHEDIEHSDMSFLAFLSYCVDDFLYSATHREIYLLLLTLRINLVWLLWQLLKLLLLHNL